MSRGEYLKRCKGITAASAKQMDAGGIEGYITAMAEREERGYSIPGRIGQGVSVLPAWMFEFAITGGLYRSGSAPVKKLLKKHIKSKLLARTGGWLTGSAVRTTAGMPQRVFANTMRRSLDNDEGWATAIAKGWGETFIEAASEEAGQTITKGGMAIIKRLPFGNRLLGSLQRSWSKLSPNNTAAKFAKKMLTKGGYSNLIGEIGEERLATIMHGLAGTTDIEGDPIERVMAGLEQDFQVKNMFTEAVVLSVPGAVRFSVAQLGRFDSDSKFKNAVKEKIGVSEKAAQRAVDMKNEGKPVKEIDQMLSQAKVLGDSAIEERFERDIAEMDTEYQEITGKTPATRGVPNPDVAQKRLLADKVAEIPTKPVEAKPKAVEAKIDIKYTPLDIGEGIPIDYLTATANSKEVGTLRFEEEENEVIIMNIDVDEAQRRKGIGTALVNKINSMFPNKEIKTDLLTDEGRKLFAKKAKPEQIVIKLKNGQIISGPLDEFSSHSDLAVKKGVDFEQIESSGFIDNKGRLKLDQDVGVIGGKIYTVPKPEAIEEMLTEPTPEAPVDKKAEIAPKVKSIEELQAEIDSYLRAQKNPPTELLAEFNAARREQKAAERPPKKPPEPPVTFKEPPRPEGPNILMLAEVERRLDEKAMLSEKRKLRPGGRRLAKQFIGKTDLKKMTEEELSKFGQIISRLPEPTYNNRGQRIPPSIPKTTAITKAGEFEREYAEPTFMRIFHAPEYYAEKLGVKSLVEKAEAGKIRFSLEYRQLSNKVDGWVKQIEKLGGTKLSEKAQAKLRNEPTKAVARFRELLDTHDEPPDSLNPKEKELFNNFRELTRWLLERENAVRESLELEPIQYRKAYVRHVAKGMAKEMIAGRYPFPQGRKFWADEIVAKKIYNTMEMHRTLTEDLEEIFSRDLGFATKSMLWTALKEIHLSQPIRYLEQQLTAKGKDTPIYKTLSPSEQAKWDKVATIPSRTRRWVKDYVNVTIKGQQSQLDQDIEAIIKKTGLNGLLNKLLAPFGRALSHKPVSNFVQEAGRAQIMGVLGGPFPIGGRPRQIIRNKFQVMQSMALYPLYKETLRTYAPIRALRKTTPDLERLLDKSLFLKAYTGTEEWPVDIKSKIAKASLRGYQWSATSNARQAMETAYWGMLPLFNKEKFKYYGWADPQRTYKEKPEFLYPSEEKLMLKEMEFGAAATQHNYTPIGMPEMFRHKTLTPITRLQSWWMNHYFRFTEEALRRAFTGKPTYSKEGGPILPWKYRLGWLRYALIAVPILNMMRYQRSYFFGAAPTGVPPFAQFAQGMYNYVVGKGAGSEQQWKRGKKQMIQSGKTFIPGYMSYKDFEAIWSGRKDLESLFFYKKR